MLSLDALILDMDGVLIDVSDSYRTATRATVQFYLEHLLGLAPFAGALVTRDEVAALKLAGGFNNDWDLTTALLKYFLALLELSPTSVIASQATSPHHISETLQRAGQTISTSVAALAQRKDIATFAQNVALKGGGLEAVRQILGDRNDSLLFAEGDLRETNLVQRLFEEFYLGETLFQQQYGQPCQFVHDAGFIHREKLMPRRETLEALRERATLGIATGRPRAQAIYALQWAGIADLFHTVITLAEIEAAEKKYFEENGVRLRLSKPHPFTLLECASKIGGTRFAYVGDTPDDMRAAKAANRERNFTAIACLAASEDKDRLRREFERVNADVIIEHPDELVGLIKKD